MIKPLLTICIVLLFFSCFSKKQHRIKDVILNESLLTHLDSMIVANDSLARINSRHIKHNSYWIFFSEKENDCYVYLLANFSYYNSDEMIGYINYKNKTVSFYDNTTCNDDIIDTETLNKRIKKINNLSDYNDVDVPPHEPDIMVFKIIDHGAIVRYREK